MRVFSLILSLALVCVFLGCGGSSDVKQLQKDLDDMNMKVGAINAKYRDFNSRVNELKKYEKDLDDLDKRVNEAPSDKQKDLRNYLQNIRNRINKAD